MKSTDDFNAINIVKLFKFKEVTSLRTLLDSPNSTTQYYYTPQYNTFIHYKQKK